MNIFKLSINEIIPSQQYLSFKKYNKIKEWFKEDDANYEPIPVINYNGKYLSTDGHHRLYRAFRLGLNNVNVYIDHDELNYTFYKTLANENQSLGIKTISDLSNRFISQDEYLFKWVGKCQDILKNLKKDNDYITIINIKKDLRLRTFEKDEYEKAILWYQDEEIQYYTNGVKEPYDINIVTQMYNYLKVHGDLYFIEVWDGLNWKPIGDVALVYNTSDDLPITIGNKDYWGKGIGKSVLNTLIEKAKNEGRKQLEVGIYDYNLRSIKLYSSLGFNKVNNKYIRIL